MEKQSNFEEIYKSYKICVKIKSRMEGMIWKINIPNYIMLN